MKEEEDTLEKKEQQIFDQFSPVEGSTKTFPPQLLQKTPTNTYSQSVSEVGSSSSWTPQFTFPAKKSKIKNEIVDSDIDPVLKESRFAKLMELLNRKKTIKAELSRNVNSTKHRNHSLNAKNAVKHTLDQSIQKIDNPNTELPFLSGGPELGGGELARQKRKGVGEEPKQRKEIREEQKQRKEKGEEPKKIKETREKFKRRPATSGEEAKTRRSAAPPEEDRFNQIAKRENENLIAYHQEHRNSNPEIFAHKDNSKYYHVNHRDMVEYGESAKRNHLEDGESKEEDMRGSNSILRMSHLLPPPTAGNDKQVENSIWILSKMPIWIIWITCKVFCRRRASTGFGSRMGRVHQSSTTIPRHTIPKDTLGKAMEAWRFPLR